MLIKKYNVDKTKKYNLPIINVFKPSRKFDPLIKTSKHKVEKIILANLYFNIISK